INLFKVGGGEQAAKEMNVPFLGRIPIHEKVVMAGDTGVSFLQDENEVSAAFNHIADGVLDSLQMKK
ncbi:MAG: ATP-binding protein, partial [Thermoplasmata archaeon]